MIPNSPAIVEVLNRFKNNTRAAIPLALVGILVLAGALTFVGYVELEDDPEPEIDTSLAMDRTDSAIQTATRDGVRSATERAAAQPLTNPDSDNPYAAVINESGDDPFYPYLKGLIYLEVHDMLEHSGQVANDVHTNVSLPAVTTPEDFAAAIDRVHLEQSPEGEEGLLEVTIDGITVTASQGGEQLVHQTDRSVTVSVATPIIDVHERTSEYEELATGGLLDRGSLTQRLNARMYGIGYLRGWAQNYQLPVVEVIANRHVEPSANDALYRTQRDVFGSADPALSGAVHAGWACMLVQDGEAFIGESEYSMGGDFLDDVNVDSETICDATRMVLDPDTELDPWNIVRDTLPGMDEEHEIEVGKTSYIPLTMMFDPRSEHSFTGVAERLFELEATLDAEVTGNITHAGDHACEEDAESLRREQQGDTSIQIDDLERIFLDDSVVYTIDGSVSALVLERCDSEDVYDNPDGIYNNSDRDHVGAEFQASVEILDTNPNSWLDDAYDYETEHEFEFGPSSSSNGEYVSPDGRDTKIPANFTNYDGFAKEMAVVNLVLLDILDSFNEASDDTLPGCLPEFDSDDISDSDGIPDPEIPNYGDVFECWASYEIGNSNTSEFNRSVPNHGIREPEDAYISNIEPREVPVFSPGHLLDLWSMISTVNEDLTDIREEVAAINATFERGELLESGPGEGPFAELEAEVESVKRAHTDLSELGGQEAYKNVAEKIVLETRYTYFALLQEQIEWLGEAHATALDALDEQLSDVGGLDDALDFLERGTSDPEPGDTDIHSPAVTDNVTYEISASPTYLEPDNFTKADVPAIDADVDQFTPLAMENKNYLDLPYQQVIDGLMEKLLDLLPVLGADPDAELTFTMAADVLLAADMALAANNTEELLDGSVVVHETTNEIIHGGLPGDDPDNATLEYHFEQDVETLRESMEDATEDFTYEAANQSTILLYNDEVAYCTIEGPPSLFEYLGDIVHEEWAATKAYLAEIDAENLNASVLMDKAGDIKDDALDRLGEVASDLISAGTAFVFGGDDNPIEAEVDELADAFDDADGSVEDAPFDPTYESYDYMTCMEVLWSLNSDDETTTETTDRILETRDRMQAAMGESIEEYNETHGLARTAEAIGEANLTDEVLAAVIDELDDAETHLPGAMTNKSGGISDEEWEDIIESAVVPGVERGASLTVEIGSVDLAERLDVQIQHALGNVSDDVVQARIDDLQEDVERLGEEKLEEMKEWVGDETEAYSQQITQKHTRAARVPAGLPLLPLPGYWYATVNAWDISVNGQYARFEVTGNMGSGDEATSLTYVREDQPIHLTIDGTDQPLGHTRNLSVDGRSTLIVVVPPGVGVGDRDDSNPDCSPTYPEVGEVDSDSIECGNADDSDDENPDPGT